MERELLAARSAKEELNITNQTHIPWAHIWGLAALVLHVMYILFQSPRLLPFSNMCIVVVLGTMIRGAALVKRNWKLHENKMTALGVSGLSPDQMSKNLVLAGNVMGLFLVATVAIFNNFAGDALPGNHAALMFISDFLIVMGIGIYLYAEAYEPTFKA